MHPDGVNVSRTHAPYPIHLIFRSQITTAGVRETLTLSGCVQGCSLLFTYGLPEHRILLLKSIYHR